MSTDVVKPEAIPALFDHSRNVYFEMLQLAKLGDDGLMVYTGHLTHLFKKLRLSVPYYTQIKNRLIGMGCIEQIKRGGGTATSAWILWKEPLLTDWFAVVGNKPRIRGDRYVVIEQRLRDLQTYVKQQEVTLDDLVRSVHTLQGVVEEMRSGHHV